MGQWNSTRVCYCPDTACRFHGRTPCPSKPSTITPSTPAVRLWISAALVDEYDERLPQALYRKTKQNGWKRDTYLRPDQWTDKDYLEITGRPRPKESA